MTYEPILKRIPVTMPDGPILRRVAIMIKLPLSTYVISKILAVVADSYPLMTLVEAHADQLDVVINEPVADNDPRLIGESGRD